MSLSALVLLVVFGVPAVAGAGDAGVRAASAGSPGELPPSNAADRVAAALDNPAVRELVHDTLERNPGLATAIAVARASLQRAPQVKALPDPVVGVTGYLSSPETRAKLQDDIAWAMQHDIQGTPLVLVNGREVPASVQLLYALILAEADPEHPAFAVLPPPQPQARLR